MNSRIIALANQKGGCGKTTTAVNLAAGLVIKGKKVLFIDVDPQANASIAFDIDIANINSSVADLIHQKDLGIRECIVHTQALDIIPSTLQLSMLQKELYDMTKGELTLSRKVEEMDGEYDFIIIDTPPSFGPLLNLALNACREIFIPVSTGFYSLIGLKELLTEIDFIKETNRDVAISGVMVTFFENTLLSRDIYEKVKLEFKDKAFNTKIRKNVRLAEAPSHHMSIFAYDPRSIGAQDYEALTKEVIKWPEKRD